MKKMKALTFLSHGDVQDGARKNRVDGGDALTGELDDAAHIEINIREMLPAGGEFRELVTFDQPTLFQDAL
jgi:hypothetical protein